MPFPYRAALTVLLLELEYAQAYAVDKESVDAEGALIAPASANVEAMRFPVLNLVSLPNTEIMASDRGEQQIEVGPSVFADLQNEFVHSLRRSAETKAHELHRVISVKF